MDLIVGATGRVGREVVKELLARGLPVRALTRNPERAGALFDPAVEIVRGDLADPRTLDAALAGVERVFLASATEPRQVELQSNLIAAAERAGIHHLVLLSALGARPDSPALLLRWPGQVEQVLRSSGLPLTILRPSLFMQIFFGFAPAVSIRGAFSAPAGAGKVGVVDLRDVAAVAAHVLTCAGHKSRIYEITGPEALSFAEMAERLSRVLGKTIAYEDADPVDARQRMLRAGMPDWYADALIEFYQLLGSGAGARLTPVVERLVGKPPRTFMQFARDYVDVFRGRALVSA